MKRRTQLLVSAGLVVAMGGAAVGGIASTASARPKAAVATVPKATTPVTTVSFTFNASVGLAKNINVAVTGSGQADFTNHLASASITLPAGVAKFIPGAGSGPEVINIVLSGNTLYVEVPGLSRLTGTPWISLTLPAQATSVLPHGFATVASFLGNVNEILNFARSHGAKVTALGSSMVDGQSVTGDQITANLHGVHLGAQLFTAASGDLVKAALQAGKGSKLSLTASVDLSGYGAPVSITVPPSSQVKAIPLSVIKGVLGGLVHKGGFLHMGAVHHAKAA